MLHINEATHPGDNGPPVVRVTHHRRASLFIKILHAVFFDVALGAQTKFLLDKVLKWQTMTIPSPLSIYAVTDHRPKARHRVLDSPRQNMSVVRQARRKWWSIIKNKISYRRSASRSLNTLIKNIVLLPKFQHCLFAECNVTLWYFNDHFNSVVFTTVHFTHM